MNFSGTEFLIAEYQRAVNALRELTENSGVPESGTPEVAIIEKAIKDCETTQLAVLEDYKRQLRG